LESDLESGEDFALELGAVARVEVFREAELVCEIEAREPDADPGVLKL